ncbi:hypothetical protein [Bifidobacterium moukalabense]|uniref:Macrolide ABC transporter ATP-binding protein n=1 Tax=Bifidobacterium moukalabense DSM 27321 TaxID=1435051 RepID=W4NA77_9BIFI|nr:hypothetical protein [Bifidobacterium moukalabense]ETY71366.1 macrolide ABC transporter ATP-binding protein [Bifidobacterium moukalabense DSM 27321]
MRNMALTPRARDLTALLNTGTPKNRNTEKPKERSAGDGGMWVKTSVSLRAETRRRLRTYAAEHDMRIQEVMEDALASYLSRQ